VSSDWNEEFTKLVRQGIGDAGAPAREEANRAGDWPREVAEAPGEARAPSSAEGAGPDTDQAAAARRASIASTLVAVGFIAADPATPDNPAVEVLAELLPLDAEHVHARTIATLRRDARGQGAGRVKIHRVDGDVLPPFDGQRFACDLHAPLRRVVVACRRPRAGSFCAGILAATAELAGRLRLWRVEMNVFKLLRRVELQCGALDALEHS
jgi:hypothetical protein